MNKRFKERKKCFGPHVFSCPSIIHSYVFKLSPLQGFAIISDSAPFLRQLSSPCCPLNFLNVCIIELNVTKRRERKTQEDIKHTHTHSLVVVRWKKPKIIGQRENLLVNRLVEHFRVAFLKIGATASTNEQCIAGERYALLMNDESHATLGVARRGNCEQLMPACRVEINHSVAAAVTFNPTHLPKSTVSSSARVRSAFAPALLPITESVPGRSSFKYPVPVMWSAWQ